MHIIDKPLKALNSGEISVDESKMLKWMMETPWEAQTGAREPIPYKTKVPEFYAGVRLYRVQAGGSGGSQGPLDLFIKKLEYQGIISKQDMYPVTLKDGARFLSLKKIDLENLGVGQDEDEE